MGDLQGAHSPLLVAGYASLDRLIDFIASCPPDSLPRLMIGHEPYPSRRETFEIVDQSLPEDVADYWLSRGISLHLSAKLLDAIERLNNGSVLARYLHSGTPLHAKVYVGDDAATIGSSNFTEAGLRLQLEANVRFGAKHEKARFRETRQIAENFWSMGRDYRDDLIALLEQLLSVVSWQEALARACAELLEGEWAAQYLRGDYLADAGDLWPSQQQGIAQALYILSHLGSVLVADATGSGKTRMGVHLIGAVLDQTLREGRLRRGKAIMVCPPMVENAWALESHLSGVQLDIYSHGKLSHARSRRHELTVTALRRAQIMCVDEGHNFLNLKSNRTQQLLRNMADHVLLFTATPINKSVVDLLRIADMLGADNLEPSTLAAFKKMLGAGNINRSLTDDEMAQLRAEIQRFTVRRTKKVLNTLIQREPERYVDKSGRPCRFPRHKAKVYPLNEPPGDRAIAGRIRALADQLFGATHFVKDLQMPAVLRKQALSEQRYLDGRLHAAKKLARYIVTSSLRSSRAALVEHIVGTGQAVERFALERFRKPTATGDILAQLDRIAGRPPRNKLDIALPDWLSDPDAHKAACEHDAAIYRQILSLAEQLTDQRERRKAAHLIELIAKHDLILAFDGRPITLAVIHQLIRASDATIDIIVATGDADSQRASAIDAFRLGSSRRRTIGLCSDSLSEGVNLQQASALVHMDMPTVVRIAEQRVGRIDRMDSPHAVIEAWWPDDAAEFALTSDERLIERFGTVENLLGSNMPLPDAMQRRPTPVDAREIINEYDRQEEIGAWDGIQDAFEPVRRLVDGTGALVEPAIYEQYRQTSARVLSRVSLVKAAEPWAFFCLTGGVFGAPRWLLLPSGDGAPITELGLVSEALRDRLGCQPENLPFDENGTTQLDHFLSRLVHAERLLLPRRKQRALDEMAAIVEQLADHAAAGERQGDVDHFIDILRLLQGSSSDLQPNWDEVAARWLDLIRPVWFEMLARSRRKRPLLLEDIRPELLERHAWLAQQVRVGFKEFPLLPRPEERVKACIIGVSA